MTNPAALAAVAALRLRAGSIPVTVVLVAGFTTGGLLLGATRRTRWAGAARGAVARRRDGH